MILKNHGGKNTRAKKTLKIGDYCTVRVNEHPPVPHPEVTKNAAEVPDPANKSSIPKPAPALVDFVQQENLALLQIEGIITLQHADLGIPFNGQQIGMHTREIFQKLLGTNLLKASDIK